MLTMDKRKFEAFLYIQNNLLLLPYINYNDDFIDVILKKFLILKITCRHYSF